MLQYKLLFITFYPTASRAMFLGCMYCNKFSLEEVYLQKGFYVFPNYNKGGKPMFSLPDDDDDDISKVQTFMKYPTR